MSKTRIPPPLFPLRGPPVMGSSAAFPAPGLLVLLRAPCPKRTQQRPSAFPALSNPSHPKHACPDPQAGDSFSQSRERCEVAGEAPTAPGRRFVTSGLTPPQQDSPRSGKLPQERGSGGGGGALLAVYGFFTLNTFLRRAPRRSKADREGQPCE